LTTNSDTGRSANTNQVFFYFGSLTLLAYLVTPTGYLLDIPVTYILKNQLHATATEVATFRLIAAVPVYFAFIFGLTRDLWSPFGLRDRGYFLIFGPLTALVFLAMGFAQFSYATLLAGMLAVMAGFRFVLAAYQALIALIGQERLMSGRLSSLWWIVQTIVAAMGGIIAGFISERLAPNQIFFLMAAMAIGIGLLAFWKPSAVFRHTYDKPQARGSNFAGDVKRLVRHRAIYPAILINCLWNFAPGAATPLQFYLTNQLHASDAVFSYYYGIFAASFIPTMLLYGFLCKKVPLNRLLWWGTIIAVPQLIPLAFIRSGNLALALAVPQGLMGGIATVAYTDLAIRSCPPGLQGTLMMLVDGAFWLSSRGGDVLGTWIYGSSPTHGFLYCVIATTLTYAAILPLILLVPKHIIATSDADHEQPIDRAAVRD
jgi:hypothetical protein